MISSYYTKTLCMNCMKITYRGERCPVCGARRSSVKNSSRALPVNYLLHRRYLIGQVLGEGGFGITYLAWDEKEQKGRYMTIEKTKDAGSNLLGEMGSDWKHVDYGQAPVEGAELQTILDILEEKLS